MNIKTNYDRLSKQFLDDKKNIIWTDKPKTGIIFRSEDFFMITFSILWVINAIYFFTSAYSL